MATRRAVINDENQYNQDVQLAANKKAAVVNASVRRPALGNLVNRTDKARLLNDKKVTATTASNENCHLNGSGGVDLKNVKARVDTHWKGDLQRRQIVTRTSSMRLASTTTATSSSASSASSAVSLVGIGVANNSGPKLVRAKATETATLKEAKLVDKTDRSAPLKRQDSTLTRRKVVTATKKTGTITIVKKTATHVKTEEKEAAKTIAEVPVVQSRFRPPTSSYSNGLIDGFGGMNIDEGDDDNTLLVCEYVNDIYAYLFDMERKYAIRKKHLAEQAEIAPRMRTVLIDWISEVHSQYHFAQETFHIAVSLIDRYLQTVKSTSRKNLQLVGVSALLIASKYEELYPPEVSDFVYITDNTYTKEQILAMEKHMLKKLKFEMGAPTPIHFLRRFSKAAHADSQTHCLSKYFIELAAIDYDLAEYLPSEIAAAALYISLGLMEKLFNSNKSLETISKELWTPALEYYTTYSVAYLRPVIKQMIAYIQAAPKTKTNNVYTKYANEKHSELAVVCDKHSSILGAMAELM